MPAISASAPGKIILFGEHAVVYQRPAIAVPVHQVKAKAIAMATPNAKPGIVQIEAPDIKLYTSLEALVPEHAFSVLFKLLKTELNIQSWPSFSLRITSTIPVASGLGSGSAVSVAILRAISGFLGKPLNDERVSALAFEVEKIYHGTPSGIDNTVVTYGCPLYYIKGQPFELLRSAKSFTLVIADTGKRSITAEAVNGVHQRRLSNKDFYEGIFDTIGEISRAAKKAIEQGSPELLGPLMDKNQTCLEQIGVSSPELEHLVSSARKAGAEGAKLSGAGLGGNLIALSTPRSAPFIAETLMRSGAVNTIITEI